MVQQRMRQPYKGKGVQEEAEGEKREIKKAELTLDVKPAGIIPNASDQKYGNLIRGYLSKNFSAAALLLNDTWKLFSTQGLKLFFYGSIRKHCG